MCTGRGHKRLLLQEVKACDDITKELRVVPYGELDSNRFLLVFFYRDDFNAHHCASREPVMTSSKKGKESPCLIQCSLRIPL